MSLRMKQSKDFVRLLRADALAMTVKSLLWPIKERPFLDTRNKSFKFLEYKTEMGLMLFQAHKIKMNEFNLIYLLSINFPSIAAKKNFF